jgi:pimeloyl-ACP methyl ester carboxylesterase
MDNGSGTKFCRGLVETPLGMIHYKYTGSLASLLLNEHDDKDDSCCLPILAFHMSPRSTDEYTEVMPLLSKNSDPTASLALHVDDHHRRLTEMKKTKRSFRRRLVVAIDEPGYGDSDNPCRSCTLGEIADAYICVANHLGIQTLS